MAVVHIYLTVLLVSLIAIDADVIPGTRQKLSESDIVEDEARFNSDTVPECPEPICPDPDQCDGGVVWLIKTTNPDCTTCGCGALPRKINNGDDIPSTSDGGGGRAVVLDPHADSYKCYFGVDRGSPHWVPGLDTWCAVNCKRGYCPQTHCLAGWCRDLSA